jgi:hypothetical protein
VIHVETAATRSMFETIMAIGERGGQGSEEEMSALRARERTRYTPARTSP